MPRRRRDQLDSAFFHVINRSAHKVPIFLCRKDYAAFQSILKDGLERHPARLVSYCLMPNHWHLVVGPECALQLSRLLHWVTLTHAVRWQHHRGTVGHGPVYQGRFKSIPIEALANLMRTCRYVERNALKAGLVARAQDWPWCSLAERLSLEPRIPLESPLFLTSRAWIDYVNAPQTAEGPPDHGSRPVPYLA